MRAARCKRRIFFLAFSILQAAGAAHAADDKSTISATMELFGLSSDPNAASIDYRERAKIVLPPKSGALPVPAGEKAEIDGWPKDPGGARKRNSDRYSKVPNAPDPEKKPGLLERVRGPKPEAAPGTDDEPGLLQRILHKRESNQVMTMDEPARRMLTDPPTGYRQPTMDLNKVGGVGAKKSSWLGGLLGSESENDPVARTGAPSEPPQQGNSTGNIFSSMMPSFMKSSGN